MKQIPKKIILYVLIVITAATPVFSLGVLEQAQALESAENPSYEGVTNVPQLFDVFQAFGVTNPGVINQLLGLGSNPTPAAVAGILGVVSLTALPGFGTVADLISTLNAPGLGSLTSSIPGISSIQDLFGALEKYGIQDIGRLNEILKMPSLPGLGEIISRLGLPGIPNIPGLPALDKALGFMNTSNLLSRLIDKVPVLGTILGLAGLNLAGSMGGVMLKKDLRFCLVKAPPPLFVIPIPFWHILIGPPKPASIYKFIGIGKVYREYRFEKKAWILGKYWPGGHLPFWALCRNRRSLPVAVGLFRFAGTSCKIGQGISCRRGEGLYFDPIPTVFNPQDPDYSQYCGPLSQPGTCRDPNESPPES